MHLWPHSDVAGSSVAEHRLRKGWYVLLAGIVVCLSLLCIACDNAVPVELPQYLLPDQMYGSWSYWLVTRTLKNGTSEDKVPTGTLQFERNERWSMNRDIGGVVTTGAGTASIDSGRLALKYDNHSPTDLYTFVLATEPFESGTRKTLTITIRDTEGTTYKYSLKEK